MGAKHLFLSKSVRIKQAKEDPELKKVNKKVKEHLASLQRPMEELVSKKDVTPDDLAWEKAFGDPGSKNR